MTEGCWGKCQQSHKETITSVKVVNGSRTSFYTHYKTKDQYNLNRKPYTSTSYRVEG